jgi:hypothetical protein
MQHRPRLVQLGRRAGPHRSPALPDSIASAGDTVTNLAENETLLEPVALAGWYRTSAGRWARVEWLKGGHMCAGTDCGLYRAEEQAQIDAEESDRDAVVA